MTLVTLRPTATLANTGTLTGGATLHAVLADSSDASEVDFAFGQGGNVTFADLTLPTDARVRMTSVRARVAALTSSGAIVGVILPPTDPVIGGNAGITGLSFTTITVGVSSYLWGDAEVDAAEARLGVGANSYAMSALYLDVVYVLLPVVVVGAPSGAVTVTNTPPVTWTNTLDADGGPQTEAVVKIFSAAQYGAGGFDPATSTATWSTTVTGPVTSVTPDVLANGTYRAYVQVAQTLQGGGSRSPTRHASAWAFSAFTLTVAPPGTPTLVATADNANGRITLATTDNPSATVSTDRVEVERSLDAGVTWDGVRTIDGDGAIAVPWVAAVGTYSDAADATTHTLVLPYAGGLGAPILAGDLLIAVVSMDGNPTLTWPADWTEIKDEAGNASALRVGVAWKRAIGGESGTITVTTSASEGGAGHILAVRDAHPTSPPEVSAGVSAGIANSDPDSLTPSWGAENTLWIAAMGLDGGFLVTAAPAGYYGFASTRWANASGSTVATAYRTAVTATENPGAFTHATIEDSRAFTIGVRPRTPTLATADYEAPNGVAVQYRARTIHRYGLTQAGWVASVWATAAATWSSADWWLKHPNRPALNVVVTLRQYGQVLRAARQGRFQGLGATLPIVVRDTRGGAGGALVLRTLTHPQRDALLALIGGTDTLLLQGPVAHGEPDRYIVVGDVPAERIIDNGAFSIREYGVPWDEVVAPGGTLS